MKSLEYGSDIEEDDDRLKKSSFTLALCPSASIMLASRSGRHLTRRPAIPRSSTNPTTATTSLATRHVRFSSHQASTSTSSSLKPVPSLPPIVSASYSYNRSTATALVAAQRRATTVLESFFRDAVISQPIFRGSNTEMSIQLFWYHDQLSPYSPQALSQLSDAIADLYRAGTRVNLRLTRLHQPYQNAQILSRYLALSASRHGFNRLQNTLLNVVPFVRADLTNAPLPSHITGIKVQLSGLLTTQKQAPRKTVSRAQAGTFHGVNVKTDYGMCESKSRLGAFCVKVWISSATRYALQMPRVYSFRSSSCHPAAGMDRLIRRSKPLRMNRLGQHCRLHSALSRYDWPPWTRGYLTVVSDIARRLSNFRETPSMLS